MNQPRLGGWLRLWIVLCVLYGGLVATIAWLDFPTRAPVIAREEFVRALPQPLAKKVVGIPLSLEELVDEQALAERTGRTERAALLAEEVRRLRAGEARNPAKPIFFVRGPDGNLYSISGPAGATEGEVFAEVRKSLQEQAVAKPEAPLWKSDPIVLQMADGVDVTVMADTAKSELDQFGKIWHGLSTEKLTASRWQAIRSAFLFWMIPSISLLVIGFAVRWIYRGFVGQRGDLA